MNTNIDDYIAKAIEEEAGEKILDTIPTPSAQDTIPIPSAPVTKTVEIPLNEYISLKLMQRDLSILHRAIFSEIELNYGGDGLRLYGNGKIMQVVEVLYSDLCESIFDNLKAELSKVKANEEEE